MLLKRVNNLCAQDKKMKANVPSGVPYIRHIVVHMDFRRSKNAPINKHTWSVNLPVFLKNAQIFSDPLSPKSNLCTGNFMPFVTPFLYPSGS